ncbi:MAG: hypothetical protein ACOZCL_08485 [Bacillota bacterium]
MRVGYNPKLGRIKTDVKNVTIDRAFLAHFQVTAANAVAQDLVSVLAATTLTTAVQNITTGITNPAVPRNLRVKGNQAGVAGDVIVTGTNYADEVITETFALNGANAVEGNKAFKTITSVQLPVEVNAGTDTVSIGAGNKLGLPYKLAHNTVLHAYRDNAKEGTTPTVAVSATALESNTVLLNSALNGTVIDVYLMV